jgi:hypothetical protein
MQEAYDAPVLVEYGSIAECTFSHPRRRHRWHDWHDWHDWDHDDQPLSNAV